MIEFDSIAIARGGTDEGGQSRRLLAELLLQLTNNKSVAQISSDHDSPISLQRGRFRNHEKNPSSSDHENMGGTSSKCSFSAVVIAATNRIEDLDDAILRRFESKVYVGYPDDDSRREMISFFLKGP